jgi:GNAT superfamily N-acetyltransferase
MDTLRMREATTGDISILADHYRRMFDEIWENKGEKISSSLADEIEQAYVRKLRQQLPDGSCRAWLIEEGHRVIASGAVSFVAYVPTPLDPSSTIAYLHSMYTEKDRRNRRCAERIVQQVLDHCRAQGIKRIILNASDAGRPAYEKLGFRIASDMMRLILE